jgi:hypothetical protein
MKVVAAAMAIGSLLISPAPVFAAADARPRSSPAKGTKDCVIGQYTSEHLEKQHKDAVAKAGVQFYMKTSSYLKFSVQKSGSVNVSIAEDTYPGSKFYFMIDGKRYSGEARYQLPLDATALAALKAEKLIQFTYTDWPHRTEISRDDVFSGFSKAYDECRQFLAKPGT